MAADFHRGGAEDTEKPFQGSPPKTSARRSAILGSRRSGGRPWARFDTDGIVSDPDIMMGKPTIKGTRITVELILQKLGEGMSIDELLAAHPHLTREQVLAALRFAADYMADEDIISAEHEAA